MNTPVIHEKEMSITRADFLRILGGAFDAAATRIEGERITVDVDGGRLAITLTAAGVRRIGLIALPVMHVRLEFQGYGPDAAAAVLAHFDRSFQRGGG